MKLKSALLASVMGLMIGCGAAHAQSAETVGSSPAAVASPVVVPPPTISAPAAVYSNGSLVNSPGTGAGGADESVVQTGSLSMTVLGFAHSNTGAFRVADDFVVPTGGWNISSIRFYAYQTGSTTTSTINHMSLRIWNGVPGSGGASVVWGDATTNVLANTTWSGIYRVTETTSGATDRPIMVNTVNVNTVLPAGTYWLDWNSGGSLGSGPWAPPVTITGQSTTGNALQFDGTNWVNAMDVGQQGLPFEVVNTSVASIPTLDILSLGLLMTLVGGVGSVLARRKTAA